MRYDRDKYLNILYQNIQPDMYDQFQKIPASQYRPATNFDYGILLFI